VNTTGVAFETTDDPRIKTTNIANDIAIFFKLIGNITELLLLERPTGIGALLVSGLAGGA